MSLKQSKKPSASVVIPNWNGEELLRSCLPSLKNQSYKDFEIIVVDNGSVDSSVSYIEKNFPNIRIVKLEKNIGFSPAVNLGIKASLGDYVILINNDTKVDKDCIKYLVKAADDHPEVGMVAAKMLQFYKPNIIDSAGDYIDAVGHANNIGMGEKDGAKYNTGKYIFLVTGGGGLFKKKVFQKVELFDNDYFAYMEDVDLGLRAQMVGFKAWYEPRAVIYHIHAATSSKNQSFKEYLQFRNMTQTIIKDFPKALLTKDLNWLKIILVNINTIRYLASKGYFVSALKAEWYILSNFSNLLKKRKKIQSSRKVDDQYIIENILPKKVTLFGLFKKGF